MHYHVDIIGIGVSPSDLTVTQLELIKKADILVGGTRLLEHFNDLECTKKVIDRNLSDLAAFIKQQMEHSRIVVLASGDPLFFGIGSYLARTLGPDLVKIHPNVSAMAAAFARLKLPWHDAAFVSCHGRRGASSLIRALAGAGKVAVFTDPDHDPAWVARQVLEAGMDHFMIWVLEQMGSDAEKTHCLSLPQAACMRFDDPNMVILVQAQTPVPAKAPFFGMPDNLFIHQQGLITKSEIRAVSLARLHLFPEAVVWDLGAGSGAVAIEAGTLAYKGKVFAVEKDSRRLAQIETNCRRLGAANVTAVRAVMPDGLDNLPCPDRVFIGGGGKNLPAILEKVTLKTKPDAVVVVNTVLVSSLDAVLAFFKDAGWKTEALQIQVAYGRPLAQGLRFAGGNPVWIIQAIKRAEAENEYDCQH